ncbi:MAG: hypothetical protein ACE5GD_01990 [Candidatus Geothermarchaeales archaeon]
MEEKRPGVFLIIPKKRVTREDELSWIINRVDENHHMGNQTYLFTTYDGSSAEDLEKISDKIFLMKPLREVKTSFIVEETLYLLPGKKGHHTDQRPYEAGFFTRVNLYTGI